MTKQASARNRPGAFFLYLRKYHLAVPAKRGTIDQNKVPGPPGPGKEVRTMNETLKVLKERRSIRKYKPEQITDQELDAILEAGTWAATANNLQTPVMVVVQDRETIDRMSALNAQIMGASGTDPFYGAPTVVVVLADGTQANWLQDGSLVLGNLMTAAAAAGIGSCWINRAMELFDMPEGKELLRKWGLPETLRGVGNCILGYPDGPAPAAKPRKEGWIIRPEARS